MKVLTIGCPNCNGRGKIAVRDREGILEVIQEVCSYCRGRKKVKLTHHLRKIGHFEELKNVEHFQKFC